MTDLDAAPSIGWDTLKLSAEPLRARNDILVVARVMVQKQQQTGYDEYRVNFELNRHHGLVSNDTELFVSPTEPDGSTWRYSGRRDILIAIKNHFLTTQLYSDLALQLGWVPHTDEEGLPADEFG